MSKSPADISASIIATLRTTAPGLSCELGTPERKIIDACSEAVSAAYVDQYLIGSLLDIDTKVGLELEQFVGIFGFGRLQGKRAKGVVRMSMTAPSTIDSPIPVGTQFFTKGGMAGTDGVMFYATTKPAVLAAGTYSIDLPVECTAVGTAGNIPPDSIVSTGATLGASSVTNLAAMTGGTDTENDAALRQRFKDTLLRNVAGTKDWYVSLCLQNTSVSRATAVGPISLFRTQVVVPSISTTVSASDIRYIWPNSSSVFTNLAQADEQFYTPDTDYTLTGTTIATFTRATNSALTVGQVVDLEFQYTTKSSRNDPMNKITNKVDVFVDGIDPFAVSERIVVTSKTLSSLSADPLYYQNFERVGSSGSPQASSRFTRLGSVPLVSFPAVINIGTNVYRQGTDYHVIRTTPRIVANETTLQTGSHREVAGLEWPTGKGPDDNTALTVKFTYNRVPELLASVLSQNKQIATDVMVHQATYQYVIPCLSIQYDRSYSPSVVDTAIINRLQKYFQGLGFGVSFKLSNLCMAVQQVLGVVDVKVTTQAENGTHYGVELYDNSNDTGPASVKTEDFRLGDNQLLMYRNVNLLRKATT